MFIRISARIFSAIICACLLLAAAMPGGAAAQFDFEGAASAAIFEAGTLTLLEGTDPDTKLDAAGLSKLPALLVILECVDSGLFATDTVMSVSEAAARATGPTAFLEAGESMAADGLLKAAVMIGASDAIVTLAQHCMADKSFVEQMNRRLTELGAQAALTDIVGTGATFTCRELAAIGAAILKTNSFAAYSNLYYEELVHADGRRTELASSNKLLRELTGCSGVATGSSRTAGYCGVFSAQRGESEYIAVVVGAQSSKERARIAGNALELAFTAYRTTQGVKQGETVVTVPVTDGRYPSVALVAKEDVTMLLMQGDSAERTVTAPETLQAPVYAGTELGRVDFVGADGRVIASTPLIPEKEVQRASVADCMRVIFLEWLHA